MNNRSFLEGHNNKYKKKIIVLILFYKNIAINKMIKIN